MSRILCSLLFAYFLISYSFSQPSWHIVTVDSTDDVGYDCHLDLDSDNQPHIAYGRIYNPNGDDLKYAYYNGNTWVIEVVSYLVDLLDPSIALNNIDQPNIAYQDYGDLNYAYYNGSSWQFDTIEQNGRCTAIAVDSLNHPHIAYFYVNTLDMKYAFFNGSNWQIQTIDTMDFSGQGDNNSITTDSQNNPHITYCQDAIGQLRYAHKVSTSWVIEYPDTLTGSTGLSTSICLDSSGNPRISHCDPLRYCSKASGTWVVQQINTGGTVARTSLALDSNNYPHIAFRQSTIGLRMAHWDGLTWQLETVDPTNGAGMYCSLKLDSEDKPCIAYQYNYEKDLMYAWYGEGYIGVTVPSFSALPAQNGIKLAWQGENSGPAQLAGFNLYRVDVSRDPAKKYIKLNQNLITGNSPYTFLDSRIELGINYQYRLWATYTDGSREEVGTVECSNNSIQPAAFSLISVYPNPAKSILTCRLSLSQASDVNLSLYDISGRLVLAKRYAVPTGEQDITVGLGKLVKGVYTVQVEAGGITQTKRIVVMH